VDFLIVHLYEGLVELFMFWSCSRIIVRLDKTLPPNPKPKHTRTNNKQTRTMRTTDKLVIKKISRAKFNIVYSYLCQEMFFRFNCAINNDP